MNVLFDSRGSRSFRVLAVASVLGGAPAVAQVPDLFERAVDAVAARHWDREFVQRELPDLVRTFRRAARVARSLAERAVVVDSLLSRVPSSHLALFSRYTFDALMAEVTARPHPTLGLKLEQRGSRFFACEVVAGGPAERAGVRRGDLVVAVDGVPPPRAAVYSPTE